MTRDQDSTGYAIPAGPQVCIPLPAPELVLRAPNQDVALRLAMDLGIQQESTISGEKL